jgi:hypothetical protein
VSAANLTVGDIRRLIADLPDDAPVYPDWGGNPPADHEPGVEIIGAEYGGAAQDVGEPHLRILVGLFYLGQSPNGYQIVRKSDRSVIDCDFDSQEDAEDWLSKHV